jgi:hypothetical protein
MTDDGGMGGWDDHRLSQPRPTRRLKVRPPADVIGLECQGHQKKQAAVGRVCYAAWELASFCLSGCFSYPQDLV